jgi:hypothetical protein
VVKEVLHGFVDEPAALAWFGQAVDRAHRSLRQNNVDASAHK